MAGKMVQYDTVYHLLWCLQQAPGNRSVGYDRVGKCNSYDFEGFAGEQTACSAM